MKHRLSIKLLIVIAILIQSDLMSFAAHIDTIHVQSISMGRSFPAMVVTPESHKTSGKKYPSLYLLHGYSGKFTGWFDIVSQLTQWSELYQIIIICPDGDYDSWYIDSPVDKHRKFETFMSHELVDFIDNHYRTFQRASSRGISGVSMGGHGAMFLGLKHPDVFGLIGSTSGALDLLPFHDSWNLQKLLGNFNKYKERWQDYSCYYLLDSIHETNLKIWIDCGTEDFFLDVNRAFHQKLIDKNIIHQYTESPGEHTIPYWKKSYESEILFFVERFRR